MAKKGYWVVCYQSVSDPDAIAEYSRLARSAVQASEGQVIVSSNHAKTREAGLDQRVVIIEFESLEKAIAAYDSDVYKVALKALGKAAQRDFRIVEGL
jgi:uncharacterized protein (DUF1330 family)